MGYRSILNDIKDVYNSEFTMETFARLGDIAKRMSKEYEKAKKKNKNDARIHYNVVNATLNEVVFYKLKATFHFRDEVINRMMYFVNFGERLEDVMVFDGNIIVKIKNIDTSSLYLSPDESLIEITSRDFEKVSNKLDFNKSLINSINNHIGPVVENDSLLRIDDKKIQYQIPRLSIYVNGSITKLLVRHGDDFFYYDANLIDNHLTLTNRECPIYILSEMLDENSKIK